MNVFKCDLYGTQKANSYDSVFSVGMICHRCAVLRLAGPQFSVMPRCPLVPEIIALELQEMQPLTPQEYDEWFASRGNPYTSKARVQVLLRSTRLGTGFVAKDDMYSVV
jgi:hypothetical protein